MLDLVFSILCFNTILIIFKFFAKYGVDNQQAITMNYVTAGTLGLLLSSERITPPQLLDYDWMIYAALIGSFFITTFVFVAVATQKVGMAIATVANKMSVIIPVCIAFFMYGDAATTLKIIGIALALAGVFLTSTSKDSLSFDKKFLPMILFIFLGQGAADTIFNYAQQVSVDQNESELFICGMFYSAGVVGFLIFFIQLLLRKNKFHYKNIIWGLFLGVPNYFTVYYFFRALESGSMQSTQVFPIYNIGVILSSALVGFILYKENLLTRNWIGIGLSALAIAAISLG